MDLVVSEPSNNLQNYKDVVDDAFDGASFNARQSKAAKILSAALKRLSSEEFKELERYIFERLEK